MEQIDITSPDDDTLFTDEEHVAVESIDFQFEQSNKLRGIYRKLMIFNGNHCYQSIKNKHKRKYKYRIDISYLNPRPYRVHNIAWKYLYAALAGLSVSAIMIYLGWFSSLLNSGPGPLFTTIVITLLCSTLILFLLFAHKSYDKIIFKSQIAGIELIELINLYPDKHSFREFMGKFLVQIKKARARKKFTPSKLLASELKELRRLKDETVITEEQYEQGKSIIFAHSAFKNN
ncbi:MAG: hypothetical protein OEY09_05770 [Gammaproteobacteria bacterium]|nr:hypothetical protein [Gammaproteobacteria bacterium]